MTSTSLDEMPVVQMFRGEIDPGESSLWGVGSVGGVWEVLMECEECWWTVSTSINRGGGEGGATGYSPPFGNFRRYYLLKRLKVAPPFCSRNIR